MEFPIDVLNSFIPFHFLIFTVFQFLIMFTILMPIVLIIVKVVAVFWIVKGQQEMQSSITTIWHKNTTEYKLELLSCGSMPRRTLSKSLNIHM